MEDQSIINSRQRIVSVQAGFGNRKSGRQAGIIRVKAGQRSGLEIAAWSGSRVKYWIRYRHRIRTQGKAADQTALH